MMRRSTTDYPLETDEQKAVVQYLEVRDFPHFHVPNEQSKKAFRIVNMRLGVKKGVPDLFIIVKARTKSELIAIEMKRQRGARPTVQPSQKVWQRELEGAGIRSYIAYGAAEAIEIIRAVEAELLKGETPDNAVF